MTDSPPPPTAGIPGTDAPPPPAAPQKFPRERRAVGVVVLALIAAIIVYGTAAIIRETYRVPSAPTPYAHCSDGLTDLYNDFAMQLSPVRHAGGRLAPYRPLQDRSVQDRLTELDEALRALRPMCEREGAEASAAYDALNVWRHHLQDLSRIEEHTLTPDAERALRYRSPGAVPPSAADPPSGTRP